MTARAQPPRGAMLRPTAPPGGRAFGAADVAAFALLAGLSYALKRYYSTASIDQLRFVLQPTAWLLSRVTGSPWPLEAGVGYVSTAYWTAIVPACAGLNFTVVAAATCVVGFVCRVRSPAGKIAFVLGAFAVAYLSTLAVNVARILLDLWLRNAALGLPHDALHRVVGVVAYLGGACLVHAALGRVFTGADPEQPA